MATTTISLADQVRDAIQKELDANVSNWKRAPPVKDRIYLTKAEAIQKAPTDNRADIQNMGKKYGCHTCGEHCESHRDQPWIGDHIYPTKLIARVRSTFEERGKEWKWDERCQVLMPSCDVCSHEQANLVSTTLNTMPVDELKKYEFPDEKVRALIYGGKAAWKRRCFIEATGPRVSTNDQGPKIQQLGLKEGCHACGGEFPNKIYTADHVFPREFCTHYMEMVFESLDLDYPDRFELRPQCSKCSCNQGGSVANVAKLAMQYAKSVGITFYK